MFQMQANGEACPLTLSSARVAAVFILFLAFFFSLLSCCPGLNSLPPTFLQHESWASWFASVFHKTEQSGRDKGQLTGRRQTSAVFRFVNPRNNATRTGSLK